MASNFEEMKINADRIALFQGSEIDLGPRPRFESSKTIPPKGGGKIIDFTSFDSEGRGSVFHLFVNRPPSKNEGTDREIAKLWTV